MIKSEKFTSCPVCGSLKIAIILNGYDYENRTGDYRIDRCSACGIRFTNPRPVKEDLHKLYDLRNSPDFVRVSPIINLLRSTSLRGSLARIFKFGGDDLKVLDFGCGDGFFTLQLRRHPQCSTITACDFHDSPPFYLQNRDDIRYCSFEEHNQTGRRYDLIICRHVLEHLTDPARCIKELQNAMMPEGMLVVEVPNYGSVWRKIFGRYYYGLYLPRHLFHFDERTLKMVLEDFEMLAEYKSHTPVLGRSLGYLLGVSFENIGIPGLMTYPLQVLCDHLMGSSTVLGMIVKNRS
jgi:2-polyprenyl-3-methyl-5-hydroxy-6-metoxy-1,4-benzoquinol methylase